VNIVAGTHSGLRLAAFGFGGVYRDRVRAAAGGPLRGLLFATAENPTAGPRPPTYSAFVGRRVVVIDNYDSFVYNLVQYLGELGAEPIVHRHDALDLDGLRALEPDALLVSPGPGRPEDAGLSNDAIRDCAEHGIPVLGVCLGHQCIGYVYGGEIVRAPQVMHGKTSIISHDGAGVFAGLPDPLRATRYHSLVVARDTVPDELVVSAESEDGTVMGLRHRTLPVEGVQFHPESILTESGHALLQNFLTQAEAAAQV
jgi:anthranilate synthase/aminodeoxychorismate synthase-like glutamine amidotransferase